VQQISGNFDTDWLGIILTAGGEDVHFAIVLTNRTTPQSTREAGLVQIANALIDCGEGSEASGFLASNGQLGSYLGRSHQRRPWEGKLAKTSHTYATRFMPEDLHKSSVIF
jgi:hypothetical protein